MAGKIQYRPGDVVWFNDKRGYDDVDRKAVIVSKPFRFEGARKVELVYLDIDRDDKKVKVHAVVDVNDLSEPLTDVILIPNKVDILKKKTKELINKMKIKPGAIIAGVVAFVVLVLVGWLVANFNSLVTMNEDVDNSWAKVETQYQRRLDLVGNLVESVKGSQLQEQEVFKAIANARSQYQNAQKNGDENGQAQAASNVETNLALVPRLQEAYPELKSNQNVQSLMGQLAGTEDQIAGARDKYNDTVTNYNKGIGQIPKVVFANWFGYKQRQQFKSSPSAATAPSVDFTSPAVQSSPKVSN